MFSRPIRQNLHFKLTHRRNGHVSAGLFSATGVLIAALACSTPALADTNVGGVIVGSTAGAVLGSVLGGHDGAVIGGVMGAVIGGTADNGRSDDRVRVGYGRGYPDNGGRHDRRWHGRYDHDHGDYHGWGRNRYYAAPRVSIAVQPAPQISQHTTYIYQGSPIQSGVTYVDTSPVYPQQVTEYYETYPPQVVYYPTPVYAQPRVYHERREVMMR